MLNIIRLAALAVMALFLSSCVVWKFDSLLTERDRDEIPSLAGRYVDSQGQRVEIKKTGFSNTFIVLPPDRQAPMRMTLELLEPGRFLVQARPDGQAPFGQPPYMLSVAQIEGKKITVYFFPNLEERLAELAKERSVTIDLFANQNGGAGSAIFSVVTGYESVGGIVGFFEDLFELPGAKTVTFTKN